MCIVTVIVSLGGPYIFTVSDWPYGAMKAIIIGLILIFYFTGIYMRPSDRDIEITGRLQELINPK